MIVKQALYRLHALHIHRSRYKCHNRALCNSVDVPTTRVEFPSLWLFPPSAALSLPLYFADCAKIYSTMHTIRGFNPLRAHVTATIKDRFEMTQRYPFTLIRDTPVTINYSESVRIYPGLFFFFGKIYLFEIFNDLSSLNYPKFKFSLSRFSQFPNASLSHRDFKFFGFFSVEFLEKSFDLHVFETFNISPLFFFNIKLFENKFLEFLILNYPRIFFFTTSR